MANPTTAPEVVIATMLQTAAVGTLGTSIFYGPESPKGTGIPHLCNFVVCYGGPPPVPYLGGEDFREFSVQVLTRGNPAAFSAGLSRARSTWVALQRGTIPAGQITEGYVARGALVRESDPVYLGKDDQERPRWVSNVRLWFKG
jgi:hypothetical protein